MARLAPEALDLARELGGPGAITLEDYFGESAPVDPVPVDIAPLLPRGCLGHHSRPATAIPQQAGEQIGGVGHMGTAAWGPADSLRFLDTMRCGTGA